MKMNSLIRQILNAVLSSSTYFFDDGSRLDYYVRLDSIRYRTGERIRKMVDVPLVYDNATGLLGIKRDVIWKWRDHRVPLNAWSDFGPTLSEAERLDLCHKLQLFLAKHPRRFKPFE